MPATALGSRRKGLLRWLASVCVVGFCFAPWALLARHYLASKGGWERDLGWVGIPSWRDFAYAIAQLNGVSPVRRGVAATLLVAVLLLASAAHGLTHRGYSPKWRTGLLLVLTVCLLPAVVGFALSASPVRLTIWELRYVLPSQALWSLAIAAGLCHLAASRRYVVAIGSVVLVALQLIPTSLALTHPRHEPYRAVADYLLDKAAPEEPAFTTWAYGIGAPLNFYHEGTRSVKPFPVRPGGLPNSFWAAYRPDVEWESKHIRKLREEGWHASQEKYFSTGPNDPWGTRVTRLSR